MKQQNLPITQASVSQKSTELLNGFIKNVDDLVRYNEDTGEIEMDEIIWLCEYGDRLRPLLKTVTRSLEDVTENRG